MVNIVYRVTCMGLIVVFHIEFLHRKVKRCVGFGLVTSKGPQERRRFLTTKNCDPNDLCCSGGTTTIIYIGMAALAGGR
jgi:hypothetical protein